MVKQSEKVVERTFPKFDKNYKMNTATKIATRNAPKSVRKLFILADHEVAAADRAKGKAKRDDS